MCDERLCFGCRVKGEVEIEVSANDNVNGNGNVIGIGIDNDNVSDNGNTNGNGIGDVNDNGIGNGNDNVNANVNANVNEKVNGNGKKGTCFADVKGYVNAYDKTDEKQGTDSVRGMPTQEVAVQIPTCFADVSGDEVDKYLLREKRPREKFFSPLARTSHTSRVSTSKIR